MELNDVRAFVSVVDKGSVIAASRELHITQPAVTKRLQRLELFLGAQLLDRTQRPAALTTAGQSALEKCRRLLNDMHDLRAAVSDGHAALADVRVGVAHALGAIVLTEPVGIVREEFPRLGLRLTTGWSRDLLDQVRTGALDVAIVLLPEADRLPAQVLGRSVGKERLVILGARDTRQSSVRRIQDLRAVQWILNPEGCGARGTLRQALARLGLNLIVAIESHNYELQLLLASQGRGLTLVPERIFHSSRLRSELRPVRIRDLRFPFTIWLVHRASADLESFFSRLSALLAAALAREPKRRRPRREKQRPGRPNSRGAVLP
jgi:DNA-binding transcriptional LysR family regulator